MFRHVVMFTWKPDTPAEVVDSIAAGLARLPETIPQIKDYRFGSDAGLATGNFDFVVVADFESVADYLVYRDDPTHRAIADGEIIPNAAQRAAIQYEVS